MLNTVINQLKNYIKTTNSYFAEGITDVYQDVDAGLIDAKGVPVFPDDTRGNYFYLRMPDNVTFIQGGDNAFSDCIPGLGAVGNIILVAIVKNANPDILVANLVNTIQSFGAVSRAFNSAIFRSQSVARQELSFMNGDNLKAALQRIPDDTTIVSINFTISNPVVFNECILNPCQC